MFLLEPLLSRNLESNIINTVQILLERLKAKVSLTSIKNKLTEHPDYPSLLSISDSLATWHIPNVSLKVEKEVLFNLPIPFMVQIKEQVDTFFSVVSYVDSQKLIISDSISKKSFEIEWDEFLSKWTNIVMVVEGSDKAVDELYLQNRKKEVIKNVSYYTGALLVAIVVGYIIISNVQSLGVMAWKGVVLLFGKIFGLYVSGLLLWYEIDKNNLVIQKVCKTGKNTNCNAVLQSPLSKIFGIVSWSEIGFVYFLGGAIFLIFESLSVGSLSVIRCTNLCATPYIIFSLIYQWKVVKQWCVLCVTVQVILLVELAIGFVGSSNLSDLYSGITLIQVFRLVFIFSGILVLWFIIKPLLNNAKESIKNKTEFIKLKNNIQIFESQLSRQKKLINDNNALGFIFGNPNATHKLVKVCNPFCGPCASTHPEIHQLLELMPDLQVQIIFSATSEDGDSRALPVKHFYAIEEEYGHDMFDKALNDWYLAKEKDYHSYSKKYPVKEDFVKYNHKLDEMSKWCNINKIIYTPTIYINGFELPDMYSVSDLKHLLL